MTTSKPEGVNRMKHELQELLKLRDDRIAELQQRLYDCENAVLLRHDAAVAGYYTKYPTPIERPVS